MATYHQNQTLSEVIQNEDNLDLSVEQVITQHYQHIVNQLYKASETKQKEISQQLTLKMAWMQQEPSETEDWQATLNQP